MRLDQDWIASHIPHQGKMCVLNRVEKWDDSRVICSAISHRDQDNPLRAHDRLAAACGIEYAAQAMAIHGALLSKGAPQRQGYLASIRGAQLHVARLDDISADLMVEVVRFSGDDNTILYDFSILADARLLLEGRAAVFMQKAEDQSGQPSFTRHTE